MANENAAQASMASEVQKEFGSVNYTNGKGTTKTPVMTFSKDHVYLGLKLVSQFDALAGVQKDAVPKVTASFNGQFVEMPMTEDFLKAYGTFILKLADVVKDVEIKNETIFDDVDNAKKLMAKFRKKAQ